MNHGIAASAGVGIGHIILLKECTMEYEKGRTIEPTAELNRFKTELERFTTDTQKVADDIRERIGEKEAEIIEGQIMIISDPALTGEVEAAIQSGTCAEQAMEQVCDTFIQMFSSIDDEMMRQRASDIHDIKTRFLKQLLGIIDVDISKVPKGTILVARDFTPSMTAGIVKENVVGIVTEVGGVTSHSAILARALEIPAVLSVEACMTNLKDGQEAIVDGEKGIVITEPSKEQIAEYQSRYAALQKEKEELQQFSNMHTQTKDGVRVELFGNIGNPKDVQSVVQAGGEGVGLFRTEFLFMDSSSLPTEEEQFLAYKEAAMTLNGKPIIIRTLDIGGDKEIPYLEIPKEDNPFLGYRAIRYCLDRTDIYRTQLRALLRASAFGDIRIMIPLVTCVEEVRQVKALLNELKSELKQEGQAYKEDLKVGVMIETPAASLIADLLAKEVDFFSIGTNDLTQYTMAVDRGNAKVAGLYSTYQPAVLRSIRNIIQAAKEQNIMVGMCGESASDIRMLPLLLAFGLDEFSVSSSAILATRKAISQITMEDAKKIAKQAMQFSTEKEVCQYLSKQIEVHTA
ncbi:phosphoenolpyruvate--protein phosphotransferase [Anaerosporobacter faecicola]|uniref:phosphoenolpyruvate--protein phosphotransferase n=1 Tax=Anaerosporobacter faecicola TaxID=2718714 RepID=UPI00143B0D7F|nr:phosphoenolpyruvate--protein phosphotransferase [Anaerosporobacter faecicola]